MSLFLSSTSILFFHLALVTVAQITPISDFPDYITARACVKSAVYYGMAYGANDYGLGCGQQSSQTCLCGSIGSVSELISQNIFSSASSNCGDVLEASSAAAIFHEYCAAAPGTDSTTNPTTTADSGSQSTTGANPKSKPTSPAATSTSSSSATNNNNNSGGDSTNNINIKTGGAGQTSPSPVPVIIGITAGLAVFTAVGLSCWLIVRRRKGRPLKSNVDYGRAGGRNHISNVQSEPWKISYQEQSSNKWINLPSEVELSGSVVHELHGQ